MFFIEFGYHKIDIDFDFEEFIKEGTEIQELRGLLYERFNNKPKEDFANKYKLYLNKD